MIIKIHQVSDLLNLVDGNKSEFARLVGIHPQNVLRYESGYVVIERDNGKMKLDKSKFWEES